MQTEICHADRVIIRITESDAQRGPAIDDKTFLAREFFLIAIYDAFAHKTQTYNLTEKYRQFH
jgi:hypothetical protein